MQNRAKSNRPTAVDGGKCLSCSWRFRALGVRIAMRSSPSRVRFCLSFPFSIDSSYTTRLALLPGFDYRSRHRVHPFCRTITPSVTFLVVAVTPNAYCAVSDAPLISLPPKPQQFSTTTLAAKFNAPKRLSPCLRLSTEALQKFIQAVHHHGFAAVRHREAR